MQPATRLAIGVGWALALASPAAAQQPCQLHQIAELKVAFERNRPVVDAEVDGLKVRLLLDSGAGRTTLFSDVVARAGGRAAEARGAVYGVGGPRLAREVAVDRFSFGGVTVHGLSLAAIDRDPPRPGDLAGLIGADLLNGSEVEFDLGQGVVRLFRAEGCESRSLAYWSPEADQAPLLGGPLAALVEVTLNGRPARAQLDTGAQRSVVTNEAAERTGGRTVATAGSGQSFGIGEAAVETRVAAFDSFVLGGETIRHVRLTVGDLFGRDSRRSGRSPAVADFPDMLLGADFFRTHRVLISNSQHVVYFTYAGGMVFPRPDPRHPDLIGSLPISALPPVEPPPPAPGIH